MSIFRKKKDLHLRELMALRLGRFSRYRQRVVRGTSKSRLQARLVLASLEIAKSGTKTQHPRFDCYEKYLPFSAPHDRTGLHFLLTESCGRVSMLHLSVHLRREGSPAKRELLSVLYFSGATQIVAVRSRSLQRYMDKKAKELIAQRDKRSWLRAVSLLAECGL